MDKRTKILNSALDLFVKNGIDSTSTAKIAKAAGVASGLIFHHFQNKENLIKELYLFIKEEFAKRTGVNVNLTTFTEDSFKKLWIDGIFQGLKFIPQVRFLHQYNYSRFITPDERKEGKLLYASQRSFFQNGIDNGLLKGMDIDFMSELLFEQSLFIIMYIDNNKEHESEIEEYYKAVKDMIFK